MPANVSIDVSGWFDEAIGAIRRLTKESMHEVLSRESFIDYSNSRGYIAGYEDETPMTESLSVSSDYPERYMEEMLGDPEMNDLILIKNIVEIIDNSEITVRHDANIESVFVMGTIKACKRRLRQAGL